MSEKKPKPDAGRGDANIGRASMPASRNAGASARLEEKAGGELPFEEKHDYMRPMRKWIGERAPKNTGIRILLLALSALLAAFLFATLLSTPLSAMEKFFGSLALMVLAGEAFRGLMGWEGFWGLIMLKDRSALDWIDRQAKRFAPFWSLVADIGMVMGYGLLSIRLLGPQARKPRELALLFASGIPLLLIFSLVVMPSAYDILRFAIGSGELNAAGAHMRQTAPLQGEWETQINGQSVKIPLMALAMGAITLLGGLAAAATVSVVLYAISLLGPLVGKLASMVLNLFGQQTASAIVPPPGGTPLLPGINLPLVEGILAMAVLLVVHELMHAFLARIHGIRLDSAGVVFFGILPFGAFVDPDEKELGKADAWKSSQVLAAGSASNMLTAVVAFFLLLGMSALNEQYPMNGIGAGFIARTLALVVALNVLVGVVNLLPLPLFDGHRLMKAGVGHPDVAHAITLAVVAAFVVNFLPWLFR